MKEDTIKISVRSIPKTFRRAKLAFTDQPKDYDVDPETLDILKAEPMLVVEVLPEAPEAGLKGGKK